MLDIFLLSTALEELYGFGKRLLKSIEFIVFARMHNRNLIKGIALVI